MYPATRDAMLAHVGQSDPWAALHFLGLSAVELNFNREAQTPGFLGRGGQPFDLSSPAGRREARAAFDAHGASVCALLMANDFSGDMETEVKWGVSAVAAAHALGAPAVRIDLVPHQKDYDRTLFEARCIEGVKRILAATESTGVGLGVENHGHITNDPAFLDRIFDGVGSPRLGLTLDTANFYWYGHPLERVYEIMSRFAARVRHTHIKNINYPADERNKQRAIGWEYGQYCCPLDEGNIDHARVARILQGAGYRGALCVEDESLPKRPAEQRPQLMKRNVAELKRCCAIS